jgi:hypothetical protein
MAPVKTNSIMVVSTFLSVHGIQGLAIFEILLIDALD